MFEVIQYASLMVSCCLLSWLYYRVCHTGHLWWQWLDHLSLLFSVSFLSPAIPPPQKKQKRNFCFFGPLHVLISTPFFFLFSFHFLPSLTTCIWFLQDGLQQQVNVTIKIEKNIKACCNYEIQVGVLLLSLCPSFTGNAMSILGMLQAFAQYFVLRLANP